MVLSPTCRGRGGSSWFGAVWDQRVFHCCHFQADPGSSQCVPQAPHQRRSPSRNVFRVSWDALSRHAYCFSTRSMLGGACLVLQTKLSAQTRRHPHRLVGRCSTGLDMSALASSADRAATRSSSCSSRPPGTLRTTHHGVWNEQARSARVSRLFLVSGPFDKGEVHS